MLSIVSSLPFRLVRLVGLAALLSVVFSVGTAYADPPGWAGPPITWWYDFMCVFFWN